MVAEHHSGANYWGTKLINDDKSPSPLLEQLCLGLAQYIARFEPSNTDQLVPQKLASFYEKVGGNYDSIFMQMSHSSLALIYRSLGCFYSLQPNLKDPFNAPNIPALLPSGLVRWLTVQILLDPDEHVPYVQQALKRFNIVNPSTCVCFPKLLPREAFPDRPDKEMVAWHDQVTKTLAQEHQYMRARQSPMYSPRPVKEDHREGYFAKGPQMPPQPVRTNSREQVPQYNQGRRRSMPDQNFGEPLRPTTSASMGDMRFRHPPRASTNSQERASSTSRHRNGSSSQHRHSSSTRHRPDSSSGHRPDPPVPEQSQFSAFFHRRNRSLTANSSPGHRNRARSPSTATDNTSGSDASSENSSPHHSKRKTALFPPSSFLRHHHRRHSHDSAYKPQITADEQKTQLPVRQVARQFKPGDHVSVPPSAYNYIPAMNPRHQSTTFPTGIKFRERIFDNDPNEAGHSSAPDSPTSNNHQPVPRFRYIDPNGQSTGVIRANNPANVLSQIPSTEANAAQRQMGLPVRVSTVTGVGGRRYIPPKVAPNSPVSAGEAVGTSKNGTWD